MKSFINFFSSIRLAIILLIIITIASILGTLIPQGRSPAEYAARYGSISSMMIRLEITRLYHSLWYIGLLMMFSLNIIICTLSRFFPKYKKVFRPKMAFEEKSLSSMKMNERIRCNQPIQDSVSAVKEFMRKHRYRIRVQEKEDTVRLLGRKRKWGVFGSDIVHLGLLIILVGGIISGMGGIRQNLNMTEGETAPIPGAEFSLRLDKFTTELYPSGAVKDWKSTLTVLEGEKEIQSRTIEVNHPLSYKGFVFYQSRYGWDWENAVVYLRITKPEDKSYAENLVLKVGEKRFLADGETEIHAMHFVPDFILNEKNQATTRSLYPNNPAVLIRAAKNGQAVSSGWIFLKFPDFSRMHSGSDTALSFTFIDLKANQYSGIEMSQDPGVNFIWIGCGFLVLGLFIAFYWTSREFRVIIQSEEKGSRIVIAGSAPKNKEAIQEELNKMIESIRSKR